GSPASARSCRWARRSWMRRTAACTSWRSLPSVWCSSYTITTNGHLPYRQPDEKFFLAAVAQRRGETVHRDLDTASDPVGVLTGAEPAQQLDLQVVERFE